MRSHSSPPGTRDPYAVFATSQHADDNGQLAIQCECGRLFRNLRRHLGASRQELAHRVGCEVSVIAALERGDAGDLPPWPETVRIVTALTVPSGVDPRPALQLIGQGWGADAESGPFFETAAEGAGHVAHAANARGLARRGPAAIAIASALQGAWAGLLGRASNIRLPWPTWRLPFAIGVVLTFPLFAARPGVLEAAVAHAPQPIADVLRDAREFMLVQFAPARDGLRWIEVDDPRTRRGDKLRTAVR